MKLNIESILDYMELNSDLKESEEFKKEIAICMDLDDNFRKKLKENPEFLELYDKLYKAASSMNFTANHDYYKEGFKHGMLIAIESLFG